MENRIAMNDHAAIANRNTALLAEIGRCFTASAELDELLREVLAATARHLHIVRGMISIHDPETDDIVADVSYGYTEEETARGRYRPGEGIIGTVIATGKPAIVPSIAAEPRFLNKTGARGRDGDEDLSFICVPIVSGDTAIGAIAADMPLRAPEPLEDTAQLVTTIAIMIAHAVNNRRAMLQRERLLREENRLLRMKLSIDDAPQPIIGTSRAMRELTDKILLVAETDTTALITGESGTGKELVADAIHYASRRKNGPFIKVNVAALPHNLIESELFGYEKGAFTGAARQKKGRFELAEGGTIFLDEIGDLDAHVQIHLLRVIQERTIERLGGTRTIPIDVRIIAATHQDLEQKTGDGSFRSDLYYRLNVFPVHCPPLRERAADIVLLADHFLERYTRKFDKAITRISSETIDLLTAYHWPGNIRELENCIERAVIMSREDVIRSYHLPPSLQMAQPAAGRAVTLEEMTNRFLREIITDHLKMTRGNVTRAAALLGTTKRILAYRIAKLGIDCAQLK